MKNISILGSTGSIGTQALTLVRRHPDAFRAVALAANTNIDLLEAQAREYQPKLVCIYDNKRYPELKQRLADTSVEVTAGMEGLCRAASLDGADALLNAVVGMIGLQPTLAAIEAGKEIALANKETLVTGGALVMQAAREKNVPIYPVDSEHSAIFQSMQGGNPSQVRKILLTASGGPFYGRTRQQLEGVTVEQALAHPNWSMGKKITIDSATLMNKGLELIEAVWLFDKSPDDIEIVVHRESVIHSAVEYADGAVIAQLGVPDMKLPIQYALTYPDRMDCGAKPLSLFDYGSLTFARPDEETFACLAACREAIRRGGLYPTLANGANEQAVSLFLERKIRFLQIGELVTEALSLRVPQNGLTLEGILEADRAAREFVRSRA